MTFKEFYLEWQQRDYTLAQNQNGNYVVLPPNEELPKDMKNWKIQVANGELKLPRMLEPEREAITQAYFKMALPPSAWNQYNPGEEKEYPSDVMDPEVFTKGKVVNPLEKLKQAPFNMSGSFAPRRRLPQNTDKTGYFGPPETDKTGVF